MNVRFCSCVPAGPALSFGPPPPVEFQNGDAVATTPPARLTDVPAQFQRTTTARMVTAAQIDRAVMQLRERPGQTAVEQVQAVLRALELTVVD